jgi:hypothetical protein
MLCVTLYTDITRQIDCTPTKNGLKEAIFFSQHGSGKFRKCQIAGIKNKLQHSIGSDHVLVFLSIPPNWWNSYLFFGHDGRATNILG